ncbi:MAG: hypothetical protein LJE85_15055, partial [Gammaproteobacteria bacterium]|nr:hypothetical protein [Gammaproteobacteria bacterium]
MSSYQAIKKTVSVISLNALLLFFAVAVAPAHAKELPDFTELVEKYGAAVVNISTTQKIKHPPMSK